MRRARVTIYWQWVFLLLLFALLPGLRYVFPTGELFWFRAGLVLALLWLLALLAALFVPRVDMLRRRLIFPFLIPGTYLFLLHSTVFMALVLTVFFRGVWVLLLGVLVLFLFLCFRRSQPRAMVLLVALVTIPLVGVLSLWWHFTMIGASPVRHEDMPAAVRPVLTVEDLKRADSGIGETHPYALAYDNLSDTLIVSFKDDWGAVFPRMKQRNHNLLVACSTGVQGPRLRTLPFSRYRQPENIAIRPEENRGWVTVLDLEKRTFHVAAFRYSTDSLHLTGFADLPVEPNGIFDDKDRDRLLVVGIQMELLELDPDTLRVRTMQDLTPHLDPPDLQAGFQRLLRGEYSLLVILFVPEANQLFLGTLGRYVHALSLPKMTRRQAPSFPITIGMSIGDRDELFVSQGMRRRILVLDATTLELKRELHTGLPVRALAPIPGTELLVAGAYSSNRTLVMDRDSGEIVREYNLGRLQRYAIPDPDNGRAFLATGLGVFEIRGDGMVRR